MAIKNLRIRAHYMKVALIVLEGLRQSSRMNRQIAVIWYSYAVPRWATRNRAINLGVHQGPLLVKV